MAVAIKEDNVVGMALTEEEAETLFRLLWCHVGGSGKYRDILGTISTSLKDMFLHPNGLPYKSRQGIIFLEDD